MAAVALSVASTAGLVALFASSKPAGAGSDAESASARIVRSGAATSPAATAAASSSTAGSAPATSQPRVPDGASQSASREPSTAPSTAPQTTEASAGGADATTVVDGAAYNNRWGNVQVEATFDANGALVDVVALQTPNDRDKSIRINDRAVPELTAEALDAQSASIDSISGATYTSHDYRRSLQSAIDAARAAGVTAIA